MSDGFVFSLLTGLFFGLQGVYGKILAPKLSTPLLTWGFVTFTLPFFLMFLILSGFPAISYPDFLLATIISFLINFICWYLFFRALRESPLSHTMPYTAFTQVFLIPVAFFWLNERPDIKSVIGIFLIFAGGYGIHLSSKNILAPIKSLFRDRGTRLMLTVSFLWSISATAEKVAVINSSQAFYGTVISILLSAAYLPIIFHAEEQPLKKVKQFLPHLFLLGLINSCTLLFQFTALKYLFVSYVIAFKRTGIIVSVLIGILFFKEKNGVKNLICSGLMTGGVFLILL
jgi:drug/metabolite transporter (DMT)-like permease